MFNMFFMLLCNTKLKFFVVIAIIIVSDIITIIFCQVLLTVKKLKCVNQIMCRYHVRVANQEVKSHFFLMYAARYFPVCVF